jgi:flagellar basal body-associated protein FliL
MELLNKIEDLINQILFWIGAKISALFLRLTPPSVRHFFTRLLNFIYKSISFIKNFPQWLKAKLAELRNRPKLKIDYMGLLAQAIDAGQKAFKKSKDKTPFKAIVSALGAPFVFLFKWAQSLKPVHFMILFLFTSASIFSIFGIALNTKTILTKEFLGLRSPASAPVEGYNRPEYYKKEAREVSFSSVKVPVYVQGINELRALMIDISIVASNRATRRWIERQEFSIRDHLVLTIEPVIPTFPLTDEGRTMLTEKIKDELNTFVRGHGVNGEIQEVRLVHILGH